MSSLTTTSVKTANGTVTLSLSTGNTSGPVILVTPGTDVAIRANTSANVFVVNSTAIVANATFTISNALTVASNLTSNNLASNNLVINSVSSNVTFTGRTTFNANIVAGQINATSFNLGSPSIATSGHTRLPNGLLLQWGTTTVNTTTGTITFPTAFAANPYSVQVQPTSNAGNGTSSNTAIAVNTLTTTTANVRSTSTAAASTVYWLAIGV